MNKDKVKGCSNLFYNHTITSPKGSLIRNKYKIISWGQVTVDSEIFSHPGLISPYYLYTDIYTDQSNPDLHSATIRF